MKTVQWLVIAILIAAAPAAADTGKDSSATRGYEDPLLGVWTSKQDPLRAITITACAGNGVYAIVSDGRFVAAGVTEGTGLAALVQTRGRHSAVASFGVFRVRVTGRDDLDVEFSADLAAPVASREHWTRSGRFGQPAPSSPGHDGGETLPKLGEYVLVEELPEAIEKVPPDFPEWARTKNIEGTVLVQALVGKDGRIHDTQVVKSIPELDDYAIAAVKQWRFKPAKTKGEPVAVWVAIPVKFTLK